jgi:hypothetical protein
MIEGYHRRSKIQRYTSVDVDPVAAEQEPPPLP